MLCHQKKILTAIVDWIDGNGSDESLWTFDGENVDVPGINTAFEIWHLWRLGGQWPLGDWLKQPLSLLAKVGAIDTVYWTWKEFRHNENKVERPRGLAALDATGLEIVRVFDNP